MVRNYKRRTERAKTTVVDYDRAAIEVNYGRCNLRKAQQLFNENRMSLLGHMNKKKSTNTEGNIGMGYKKPRMIFPP